MISHRPRLRNRFCLLVVDTCRARRRKLNLPCSSEIADLVRPVSRLLRRKSTPGSSAPEGSNDTPAIAPVEVV